MASGLNYAAKIALIRALGEVLQGNISLNFRDIIQDNVKELLDELREDSSSIG